MRLAWVLIAGVIAQLGTATAVPLHATVRGASLGLFASDPRHDSASMLGEMRARGASDVLLVSRLMQTDVAASELRLEGGPPARETIRRTLRQARELGLWVGLMPIVGLDHRGPGDWRGRLEPVAVDRWLASYGALLRDAAALAAEGGVERLVLGSELDSLERYESRWRALAEDLRSLFPGLLAYSANWDRFTRVPFWDAVDTVGVSAYFRVDGSPGPRAAWTRRLAEIEAFAGDREVLLTEVGYPAHAETARYPWDETRDAAPAIGLQAALLTAFCEAYEAQRPVGAAGGSPWAGYSIWNWFGVGGPRDRGYSLRGKPAAAHFERCMEESER